MFTGIVTHRGRVAAVSGENGRRLEIEPGFDPGAVEIGASVAHSGVCLTVTARQDRTYVVEASAETLVRTSLGRWRPGTGVNLERALKLGDELGGHLVFGHVDAVGEIVSILPEGQCYRLRFAMPETIAPLVAVKGSIAIDGISLTVNEVGADFFGSTIIPHTWAHTTLNERRPGDLVNLEADMLARYVARQLDWARGEPPHG